MTGSHGSPAAERVWSGGGGHGAELPLLLQNPFLKGSAVRDSQVRPTPR